MNYPSRRTRITYEGASFLSILAFIVLGSILRQINLLVLLSGLMIAPFFFNWRISRKMLQQVRIRRHLPAWAHAGTPFGVEWKITNDRKKIASWVIRISDRITTDDPLHRAPRGVDVLVHQVDPGQTGSASFQCIVPRRGVCQFGPALAGSAYPLGLVRTRIRIPESGRLAIAPALGRLSPDWFQLIRSSPDENEVANRRRRGTSHDDFFSLRNWQQGDSRRLVHWRSSAKRGQLLVRQGVDPATQRITILVDVARGTPESVETLASMAATIACQSSGRYGPRQLSLGIYGRQNTDRPVTPGPAVLPHLMELLAAMEAVEDTGILNALRKAQRQNNAGDRIIVLSNRSHTAALARAGGQSPAGPSSAGPGYTWIDITRDHSFFEPGRPARGSRMIADTPPAVFGAGASGS